MTSGKAASSTDPHTWASHRSAAASSAGTGKGFVLNGDGIACIDLDHCLSADGSVKPWARRILDSAPPTWVERSLSGDGLHIWGLAALPRGRRIGPIEVYGNGRYIAVTGHTFEGAPLRLADISDLVSTLL